MHSFITAFNDYAENKLTPEYDTIEGNLRFVNNNDNLIVIDAIYVKECFRQRGILKKFLEHVVNYVSKTNKFKFMIVSVLSKILYEYLERFMYNNHKFKLTRDGFLLVKVKVKVKI